MTGMPPATDRPVVAAPLLVIGAGPYGVAIAAHARARGIDTAIVGRPMRLWREHMPAGMFLRSGPDWHLDAGGVHTFEAYLRTRGLAAAAIDPLPIEVFLGYTDWFIAATGLVIRDDVVTRLSRAGGRFVADLAGGGRVVAERVVAATGIAPFQRRPAWAADLPAAVVTHTCDLVDFAPLAATRVLIVGGRQSAYEWAALAADHGAAAVHVVHRHPTPRFAKVSWRFVDAYVERSIAERGWWRRLPAAEQQAISRRFWEVGRLTLEPWLPARLPASRVQSHPDAEVASATAAGAGLSVRLSTGRRLDVDRVVLATGYAPQLAKLDYLAPLVGEVAQADGFPVLDEGFQSSVPGLYFTGFAATRDFGPFFGFTKGCPAAATILVGELMGSG